MTRVRVLLAGESASHRRAVRSLIEKEEGLTLVGEVSDRVGLLLAVGEVAADVVILELPAGGEEPGVASHLLAEYPDLIVLALAQDRSRALLCHRPVTRRLLPAPTDGELLKLLRRAREDRAAAGGTSPPPIPFDS